jgi:hypothetical protein
MPTKKKSRLCLPEQPSGQRTGRTWCYDPVLLTHLPPPSPHCPALTAFLIGQLFNRWLFFFQQGHFLWRGAVMCADVESQLVARVKALGLSEQGDEVSAVVEELRKWGRQFDDERYLSWLESMRSYLDQINEPDWDRSIPGQIREEMLRGSLQQARHLRTVIVDLLGTDGPAFRLGEIVDQGLCPEDIALHLDAPPVSSEPLRTDFRFGGSRASEEHRSLAGRFCQPGDLPWGPDWYGLLAYAWSEVSCIGGQISLPTAPNNCQGVEERLGFVRQVADLVVESLVRDAERRLAQRPRGERLQVACDGQQTVWLDSARYAIEHQATFLLIKALIEADEPYLKSTELLRKARLQSRDRPDKYFKRYLPEALRPIVRAHAANGGGYRIELPPPRLW